MHYPTLLLLLSTLPIAALGANPQPIELFDTRNFCVMCTFNDALLSPATLRGAGHDNANISASYVYNTTIEALSLNYAFLYAIKGEHFSIKNSTVNLINLTYSDLPYLTFSANQGKWANFTGSGLNYGNFRDVQLEQPIFTDAALVETDFTNAQLHAGFFNNSWLKDTNFTNAELTQADFTDASLENTNFTGANLRLAKITEQQLANAILCNAILPDGSLGDC